MKGNVSYEAGEIDRESVCERFWERLCNFIGFCGHGMSSGITMKSTDKNFRMEIELIHMSASLLWTPWGQYYKHFIDP